MYSNFKQQAIEYVKQAIQEDNAGNYAKAFPLYMNALEYFKTHLKYEKNPEIKEAISQKFTEYLRRAEEIRSVLDDNFPRSASSGDVAVAMKPETNSENCGERGGEGDEEDPELSKLRAGSNSAIVREKLNNVAENEKKNIYSNFKEQAIEYVKQAVQEDNAGNYAKAFPLYMNALENFKTHLKYEKNPKIREVVSQKFTEYLRRAKEIRFVLDDGWPGSTSSGDVSVAMRPEMKPENGGEGDGEDPEQSKLRAGSNCAIVREKPNNVAENEKKNIYSNFKEQAIEYVKQVVQEDNAGNYAKAFPLYMNALEYFKAHLKYEENPKIKEAISQKFTEYLRRAEEIRFVLDYGWPGSASSGDVAVAMMPETKLENGGERGGEGYKEDPEQSKLRAGSSSTIVREKPNNVAENEKKKMYSNFKEQSIEYVKQAVQEDNAGNYTKAFPLYMAALEYFKTHLKYEKNPKIKEAISQKYTKYLRRSEEIRFMLDDGFPRSTSSGDVVVVTRQKTKPKNGGEGDGEDHEQSNLRAGLNSPIEKEKSNVKVAEKPRTAMGRCWPCKSKQRTRFRS